MIACAENGGRSHAPSKLGGHSTDPRPTIVNRPLVDVLSVATLNRTDSTEYSV